MEPDAALDEQIISLIASNIAGKFKKVNIGKQTSLQKELGLDSIGMLALVFRFEELFGVDIAQMGIEVNVAKLKTVDDLINAGRDILSKAQASQVS
jgi:acyl carrier protein